MTAETPLDETDPPFTLYIDADGAPRAVKEIVFKAAQRLKLPVVVVANHWQEVPRSRLVRLVEVPQGMDVADDWIVASCRAGDVIVSGDIPLAAEAVAKGAVVIGPRGEILDAENVRQRLAMRDFMEEMRAGGEGGGGPPPYGPADRQRFASGLDRLLTRRLKGLPS